MDEENYIIIHVCVCVCVFREKERERMELSSDLRKNDTSWFEGKWTLVYVHNGVLLSQKNKDMCSVGKCMQLEDIMLSEVSQVKKDKEVTFSLMCTRLIQTIKTHTQKSMIIYKIICKNICNTGTSLWKVGRRKRKRE
jgi:hypothetical protein